MEIWRNIQLESLDTETWKPIPEYETRYLASSLGRIKSLPNIKIGRSIARFLTKERILRQTINRLGYLMVCLSDGNKGRKTKTVHRLVGLSFKKPQKGKLFFNHIDGVKTNNKVENIEYCTASENILHARRTGLSGEIGETSHNAKLSNSQVLDIFNSDKRIVDLQKQYGVSSQVVYGIKSGKGWGHLTGKKYVRIGKLLTDKQVLEIYKDERTLKDIAKDYSITYSYVSYIKSGKLLSRVTGKEYIKKIRQCH